MAEQQYINYGEFNNRADKIKGMNDTLKDELMKIKDAIKSLEGDWESNSAKTIREKIEGMIPTFNKYYDVVDNYVTFIKNTARTYENAENSNNANANKFI
ncbi:MAG: WXG100 family type VII secretion target [Lachnospiraceae bacterium]|jgi:WXG100 family type VII secretion target|nr:WXG100 family type VII secretion target [Lachnospiraceae bacterium]